MDTQNRLLRADAEEFEPEPPKLSKRRQEQRDRIFRIVPRILARRGTEAVTIPALALALDLSTASLRRHVIDRDYLLFKILHVFLQTIAAALAELQPGTPEYATSRAAALHGAGSADPALFAAACALWHRDRALLPEDLLETLEAIRASLAVEIPQPVAAPQAAKPPAATPPPRPHTAPANPQPSAKSARGPTTRQLAHRVFAATACQPEGSPNIPPLSPAAIPPSLRPQPETHPTETLLAA